MTRTKRDLLFDLSEIHLHFMVEVSCCTFVRVCILLGWLISFDYWFELVYLLRLIKFHNHRFFKNLCTNIIFDSLEYVIIIIYFQLKETIKECVFCWNNTFFNSCESIVKDWWRWQCPRNYSLVINKLKKLFFQQKTHSFIILFNLKKFFYPRQKETFNLFPITYLFMYLSLE